MPIAKLHRPYSICCLAFVALAAANCSDLGAGSPPPAHVATDLGGAPDLSGLGGSGPDGAAPGDMSGGGSDGGPNGAPCSPMCSDPTPFCDHGTCRTCTATAGCSPDTPVCDPSANGGLGQCKQIEVIAFFTPDPQQGDRAHAAYQRHANDWFPMTAAQQKFFTYESTTDWTRLATMMPAKGRIVMFLDTSPGDAAQQAGFKSYMDNGGAWMGCHFSGYNDSSPEWNWRWYFDEFLGGGLFVNNTWQPTSANLHVEDMSHPVTKGLGAMFASAPSEWYSWTVDLRTKPNIKILLSVDPSSFPLGTDPNQSWYSGYYPIMWTNTNYKMIYINAGHEQMDYATDTPLSSTFDSPTQDQMYMNAFKWLGDAQQ
jgi:hypothetical protein